jgi:xanthine dehydrogenase accessory factor
VHSPAGLDINAHTPAEVALSILAEIVATRPHSPAPPQPRSLMEPVVVTAIDPVCGMTVAVTEAALRLDHAGQTWYFCGSGCRSAAAGTPAKYLHPAGDPAA